MYGMASCRGGGGRGRRGTLLIVFMCDGLDKKRNDFWGREGVNLLRVKNAIQYSGREGVRCRMSEGGQRVDILHALHILWRVNTRPCVTWQKERTAKRVRIGEGREGVEGEVEGARGSPGIWS